MSNTSADFVVHLLCSDAVRSIGCSANRAARWVTFGLGEHEPAMSKLETSSDCSTTIASTTKSSSCALQVSFDHESRYCPSRPLAENSRPAAPVLPARTCGGPSEVGDEATQRRRVSAPARQEAARSCTSETARFQRMCDDTCAGADGIVRHHRVVRPDVLPLRGPAVVSLQGASRWCLRHDRCPHRGWRRRLSSGSRPKSPDQRRRNDSRARAAMCDGRHVMTRSPPYASVGALSL